MIDLSPRVRVVEVVEEDQPRFELWVADDRIDSFCIEQRAKELAWRLRVALRGFRRHLKGLAKARKRPEES